MICNLNNFKPTNTNTNIRIKQISNRKELEKFLNLLSIYDSSAKEFYQHFNFYHQYIEKLFIGLKSEIVVTIATVYLEDNIGGIFSLITDENQRRKGYALK